MKDEIEYIPEGKLTPIVEIKIQRLIDGAIGRTVRVRTKPQESVVGVIKSILFAGWKTRGKRKTSQFEIRMECGAAQVIHKFLVNELPTGNVTEKPVVLFVEGYKTFNVADLMTS